MGRRPGRAAAKRAAAALESTPKTFAAVDEDEPMADADANSNANVDTDADSDEAEAKAEPAGDDDENEAQSAEEAEEENEESASVKSPSPPPQPVIRKKRLGRPPKNRPPDWDQGIVQERDDSTPRRRGRGGYRGRGGRKGQQPSVAQQPIDKDGNMMDVVDDEVALPDDPDGEKKVDKLGNLQEGRDYRCRTFTILGRGQRLYMLSTEPARCVGFRDSYLFFTKHRKLYKIIVDEDEKRDMIEREIIPHSYKGRSIGVVTARSVFREFGALIIVGGRRVIDDYDVAKVKEEGLVEGELADPNDNWKEGDVYNKNQYVAWHGASAVYHQTGPAIPLQAAKVEIAKKRRVGINDTNWMYEHAREASQFNNQLSLIRAERQHGSYDIHTNLMLKPAMMQPTHVRIEEVTELERSKERCNRGPPTPPSSSLSLSSSSSSSSSSLPPPPAASTSSFPPLGSQMGRNFYVVDTYMEIPAGGGIASAAYDTNSDPNGLLAPFRGLEAVSDEMRDLLPPECRKAFDKSLANEMRFKASRETGPKVTCQKAPKIDKSLVPYSVNVPA